MGAAKELVIVGAGGFAREIVAWASSVGDGTEWRIIGIVSPELPDERLLSRAGAVWLGSDEEFLAHPRGTHIVLAIGSGPQRLMLAEGYDHSGLEPATLVHPTASVGPDVVLGEGTIVCHRVILSVDIEVGRHVHLDRAVTVGHDTVIRDFATLHPAAVVSGAVEIGRTAEIGANACILQGRHVGAGSRIGAGAVVARDVDPGSTVIGVPARPVSTTSGD